MHPHEKPGYVDACRKAGVCPAATWWLGVQLVYCDKEHHPGDGRHHGQLGDRFILWADAQCAPLEQGTP